MRRNLIYTRVNRILLRDSTALCPTASIQINGSYTYFTSTYSTYNLFYFIPSVLQYMLICRTIAQNALHAATYNTAKIIRIICLSEHNLERSIAIDNYKLLNVLPVIESFL